MTRVIGLGRCVLRAVALGSSTLGLGVALLVASLVATGGWVRGTGWRLTILRLWARAVSRIVGLRVSTIGSPPRGSFVLVSNHLSYLDIIVFASLTYGTFVAKSEVADWPCIGRLSRQLQTIFIDRGRKRDLIRVLATLRQCLDVGEGVVFFPEGTTTDGSGVLPFKSSLFEVAVRTAQPTHCASIRYSTPPGSPDPSSAVCWWGDMTFGKHLFNLLQLPSIHAAVRFGDVLPSVDRKLLARTAHAAVRASFAGSIADPSSPVVQGPVVATG